MQSTPLYTYFSHFTPHSNPGLEIKILSVRASSTIDVSKLLNVSMAQVSRLECRIITYGGMARNILVKKI